MTKRRADKRQYLDEGLRLRSRNVSLRSARGARSRTIPELETLARLERDIRRLYKTHQVEVVSGSLVYRPGAREQLRELQKRRNAVAAKVSPTQLPAGYTYEIHRFGKSYRFAPYSRWGGQCLAAAVSSLPTPNGPLIGRDHLIWLLWHLRHLAIIEIGTLPHRVRGQLVECVDCGDRQPQHSRSQDATGRRSCWRCASLRFRPIRAKVTFHRFGRVTKLGLQRRFKVGRRTLDHILATPLPAPLGETIRLF